jgi:hypothetical protein
MSSAQAQNQTKSLPAHEAEELAAADAEKAAATAEKGSETIEDIDDLLAEIDSVLEEQSVLVNFRQRGGE